MQMPMPPEMISTTAKLGDFKSSLVARPGKSKDEPGFNKSSGSDKIASLQGSFQSTASWDTAPLHSKRVCSPPSAVNSSILQSQRSCPLHGTVAKYDLT